MPTIRLIPIVLFASASLLALKTAALVESGGYVFGGPEAARAQDAKAVPKVPPKRSWAQEMLGYPEYTGSVGTGKPAEPEKAKPAAEAAKPATPAKGKVPGPETIGAPGPLVLDGKVQTPGERAVLESLQDRRKELEARTRELDIREGLVKAAEKRLEARLQELKTTEAQVKAAMEKKSEAESQRFKGLVTMYENMKAKDAARIFDRLEMRILLDVASEINPRRMSDILAQMAPEAAERLTVELASRANAARGEGRPKSVDPLALPKIEGRPRPQG
jgi:flagellar motility protein MotE (MotC chaperone)